MNTFTKLFESIFPPLEPVAPGLYRQTAPSPIPRLDRLHLRVEPDHSGILIVNGQVVLHLNSSAVDYALCLVEGFDRDQTIRIVTRRYRIPAVQAGADFDTLVDRIHTILETEDADPIDYQDIERALPASGAISAPYRLHCALTYRQPDSSAEDFAPIDRVRQELDGEAWSTILQKAWDAGIPHVVFTGGEPTAHKELPQLVEKAASLGMVSGLITNGLKLTDVAYLQGILQAGLDHLMFILHPADLESWKVLQNLLAEDLSVTVHLTVQPQTLLQAEHLITRLEEMGVRQVSLSASDLRLQDEMEEVRTLVAEQGMKLVWDLPVPYSEMNPVALELAGTREAGPESLAFMYVEPDGDVTAAQGFDKVYGNLLSDPWDVIWAAARS